MKRVYLLRHAKARRKDRSLADATGGFDPRRDGSERARAAARQDSL
jgi:phosphohistidine phosphatase SixA